MHDPENTQFILIYLKRKSDRPNQMEADGFPCFYLFEKNQKIRLIPAVFKLVKLLKKHPVDLIHAHNRASIVCAVWTAIFLPHIKVLAHVHSFNLVRKLKRKLFYRILGWKIDCMAGCSESTTRFLKKSVRGVPQNRFSTILNSINTSRFSTQTVDAETIRAEWNLTSDHFVLLGLGRLSKGKGFAYLIPAFKTVHEQYPNARLLIAGDGPQKDELIALISKLQLDEVVYLAGFRTDVSNLLHAADCFVLSSLKETFDLVVLEAMAAKCPVIATDSGGVKEMLSSPNYGILIPSGDQEALTHAMNKVLQMPRENRQKQCKRAFEVFDRFSHEAAVASTESLYTKILKTKK